MRKIILGAVIIVMLVLGVAGCTDSTMSPDPVPTVSPTVAAPSEPMVTPEPGSTAEMPSEREVKQLVMELTWENATQEDRIAICDYYRTVPEQAIDQILESAGDGVTGEMITDFLDAKC